MKFVEKYRVRRSALFLFTDDVMAQGFSFLSSSLYQYIIQFLFLFYSPGLVSYISHR